MVCRDADSPPDQVVALQSNCESIVEGKEILDLPRLPSGGRRDSCFALILPQDKFLLLLSDSPDECTQWLKLLRKVKEGVTSPLVLKRQQSITPCITDREPLPDVSSDKDPSSPHLSDKGLSSPRVRSRENSFRHRGGLSLGNHFSDIIMVLWMWCYGLPWWAAAKPWCSQAPSAHHGGLQHHCNGLQFHLHRGACQFHLIVVVIFCSTMGIFGPVFSSVVVFCYLPSKVPPPEGTPLLSFAIY
ncbi:pleckstrin -like protein [Labeo rohita]|uniref:Pleckstrin-like protein n=1 Tax=Labeo rohita TaxID=84645 RepID=A0A498P4C5_LABRO|nr:pleckstrin -like protein [Labeo rohita]